MKSSHHRLALALLATTILAAPARAEDDATLKQLQLMQEQIQKMQVQMEQLKKQAEHARSEAAAAKAAALSPAGAKVSASAPPPAPMPKITFDPAPKFESADGNYSFKVGGFAQIDAGIINDDRRDHPSGTSFRRARINASGTILQDFNYKFETDFANNATANTFNATITDMYLQYTGLSPVTFTVGQFKEPFGLEQLTSDLYVTFMERALLTTFTPERNIGGQVATSGSNWTAALGAFGSNGGTVSTDDEAMDITGRLTYAPIADAENRTFLHLGIAGSYREPLSATDSMRFSSKPESVLTSSQAVDTGSITGVDQTHELGLEAAFVYGPFALQGEYMRADVDRRTLPDATLSGYYAEASYFLTGESRNYQPSKGRFEGTKVPQPLSLKYGTWGAWQVAARFSELDLTDAPVNGGAAKDITLGLNWYPHNHVRVSANYIKVNTDGRSVTPNDDPEIWTLRTQFDF